MNPSQGLSAFLATEDGNFVIAARHCAADGVMFGGFGAAVLASVIESTSAAHIVSMDVRFLAPCRSSEAAVLVVGSMTNGPRSRHCTAVLSVDGASRAVAHAFTGPPTDLDEAAPQPAVTGAVTGDVTGSVSGDPGARFVAAAMPRGVAPPADCPVRPYRAVADDAYMSFVDVRTATPPSPATGTALLWARLVGGAADPGNLQSAASLAVLADHLPFALGYALDLPVVGLTVNSSLTVLARHACEWVLLETVVDAMANGMAHGSLRIWSEDGRLLGLGTQTMRVWAAHRTRESLA